MVQSRHQSETAQCKPHMNVGHARGRSIPCGTGPAPLTPRTTRSSWEGRRGVRAAKTVMSYVDLKLKDVCVIGHVVTPSRCRQKPTFHSSSSCSCSGGSSGGGSRVMRDDVAGNHEPQRSPHGLSGSLPRLFLCQLEVNLGKRAQGCAGVSMSRTGWLTPISGKLPLVTIVRQQRAM